MVNKTENIMMVNLGCGSQVVDGWTNVDYAAGARFMKNSFLKTINRKLKIFKMDWSDKIIIHDLRKRFPWEDGSVNVIYSSHTLEHLSRNEGISFLKECLRVLKPGGIIRIIVPDLRVFVSRYMGGEILADDFLLKMGVESSKESKGMAGKMLSTIVSFPHRCMYDEDRLVSIMSDIGFKISPAKPMVSNIDHIDEIERHDRTAAAVIVEGTKG